MRRRVQSRCLWRVFIVDWINLIQITNKFSINTGSSCYQQMFEPVVISETEQLVRKSETFQLYIIPPPYIIHFQYEIKTPMIHFLCYIASTVNLWLGVSAFPLVKFLINMKGINLRKDHGKDKEANNNSIIKYDPANYQKSSDSTNNPSTQTIDGFQDIDRYWSFALFSNLQ